MFVLSVVVLFNLIGVIVPGQCVPTTIVQTTSGPVQGEILNTGPKSVPYSVFKGIPYAQPPVQHLRFKPPTPVLSWTNTLNATTEGSVCSQGYLLGETQVLVGSEDCLFLNIFTPKTKFNGIPVEMKPVIFWIHGGGFMSGSGSMEIMRPDYFLENGIVFVSINYRLGALGFLSLDHPEATGNAGLKDQNLALQWVRWNIAKFGGDHNNITLMGHGAGAASVGYHILSKSSTNFFHGAISMSGSPLNSWAFQKPSHAAQATERMAKAIGLDTTNKYVLLKGLTNASPEIFITSGIVFTPTVERVNIAPKPFITESPYQTFYTGNYNKVPQILGVTEQETVGYTTSADSFLGVLNQTLNLANDIGIEPLDSLTAVKDVLMSGRSLDQVDSNTLQTAINITSELLFASSIDRNVQFLTQKKAATPVFYYRMLLNMPRSRHNLEGLKLTGAGHGDDLALIFYMPRANDTQSVDGGTLKAMQRVSEMWANFAAHGNPTPKDMDFFWYIKSDDIETAGFQFRDQLIRLHEGFVKWPFSTACRHSLDIGKQFVVRRRLVNKNFKLIQALSWIDEKAALNIPGLLRPSRKIGNTSIANTI